MLTAPPEDPNAVSQVPQLSLFVPFFNEEEVLTSTLEEIISAFEGTGIDFELLLVDDGSTDASAGIALSWSERDPRIRLIRHETNRKYGGALTTGFTNSRGAVVAYADADLPVDPVLYIEHLPLLDQVDMVVGTPIGLRGSLRRRIYTWGYRTLVRMLLGVGVGNVNFSFKMLRRSLVDQLQLGATTGFVDAQLLAESARLGASLQEVDVPARPRLAGVSHFDSPKVAWDTGMELVRWWWANRRHG